MLEKFGKLDILVNNAAITRDGLAMRMKLEDWDAVTAHESDRRASVHPASLVDDDEGPRGPHHQYCFGGRANGQSRAGELCGREGGLDRLDESDRHGSCFAKHHRECRGAWLYRNADDRCAAGQGEGRVEGSHPAGAHGAGREIAAAIVFPWPATKPATSPATCST